jgi:hypothetical protein
LAACSSPDQIILKLSSITNAHGEFYNGTTYPIEICYDTIFGSPGDGDRTCQPNGENKVLGLSSITNAHAEGPSQDVYPIDVCYGNLSCRATTNDCITGEERVLSLSSITNAHLASDSSPYPYNICCTPLEGGGGVCTLNSASWDVVQTVERYEVNLEVATSNCQGLEISFEIKEQDLLLGPDKDVTTNPVNVFVDGAGNAVGNWTAEWQDDTDWIGEDNPPEYYFIATLVGTSTTVQSSNLLEVFETEPPCEGIDFCPNYGNQEECENNLCRVERSSIPSDINCDDPDRDCWCAWYASESKCKGSWTEKNTTTGSDEGICYYGADTTDTCADDGYLTVTWTTIWKWALGCDLACKNDPDNIAAMEECVDDDQTQDSIKCPAQIPLPFFTWSNLIIALIIIALVYWLLHSQKKSRKRKK